MNSPSEAALMETVELLSERVLEMEKDISYLSTIIAGILQQKIDKERAHQKAISLPKVNNSDKKLLN